MKRLTRALALLLLILVIAPRTALALEHPATHEIYTVGAGGEILPIDTDPVQGISYDEKNGILYLDSYGGNPIGIDHSSDNKCDVTVMVTGTNTITIDGKTQESCIEFVGMNNSMAIRSEKGATLNLNVKTKSGGILTGIFAGGGLAIGGNIDVNILLENTSTSKDAAFYGVFVSEGTFLIRDKADVSVRLKGKCIDAQGANLNISPNQCFQVTTSGFVTFDLTGVSGCDTYGLQAQQCSKPFMFAGCPSIMFRADDPWYDGYNAKRPDVVGYNRTSSAVSHEYTPDKNMVPVYRMYNTKTSEHLYTPRKGEYDAGGYGNYADWRQEGVGWWAPPKTAGGAKPVYRLYNKKSGDHHYTTSVGEKNILMAGGDWTDEGIAFYSGGVNSVYRLYNGTLKRGQHHYTTSMGERDALVKSYGWKDEGIGFTCLAK